MVDTGILRRFVTRTTVGKNANGADLAVGFLACDADAIGQSRHDCFRNRHGREWKVGRNEGGRILGDAMSCIQFSSDMLFLRLQNLRSLRFAQRPIVIEPIGLIRWRSSTRCLLLFRIVDGAIIIIKSLSSGSSSTVTSYHRRLISHGKFVRRVLPSSLGIIITAAGSECCCNARG